MTECTCKPTLKVTQLTVQAAIDDGFYVTDQLRGDYDPMTDRKRPTAVFAGTLDQCLTYIRDKMGTPA
jgi:hypothetical protein